MDDIKNNILDKAKERLDRFGFKKTTMDEISKDCRISKKTIYEHFKDKEDMFTCLLTRECHKTIDMMLSQVAEIADPLERLIQLVRIAIAYFNEDNFVTRLLKDDEELFSAFLSRKYHALIDQEIISSIAAIINEGKQQGIFRDVDENVVAYAGFKLFQSFSIMRTGQFLSDPDKQEYYTDVLVDFLAHALVKK
ncbi:TetR/AcrR family transcriptional regulator [Pelosinus sp. IPA-1]|uniref:TetR/AcrR family transcriptional regulator n=1 Tax=Pelosinus sp. IPA-1 TaxID=3029569 RepID=UPI0024362363|nr:TetR/AcrR family transcriptional regulator [Pelosinus sp. IPA-1]GMA98871.1 TetR family transcriptional regulator [Pelosinus sp. IPA-1]